MAIGNQIKQYTAALRGRRIFAAIAIIAAVGAVATAQALSAPTRSAWRRGRSTTDSIEIVRQSLQRGSPWLDLLKATDKQRVELRQAVDRHEAALRQLESDRNRLTEALSSAFAADGLNPTDIDIARSEARALSERAIDESVALVVEGLQILSPEQRKQLIGLWRAR